MRLYFHSHTAKDYYKSNLRSVTKFLASCYLIALFRINFAAFSQKPNVLFRSHWFSSSFLFCHIWYPLISHSKLNYSLRERHSDKSCIFQRLLYIKPIIQFKGLFTISFQIGMTELWKHCLIIKSFFKAAPDIIINSLELASH